MTMRILSDAMAGLVGGFQFCEGLGNLSLVLGQLDVTKWDPLLSILASIVGIAAVVVPLVIGLYKRRSKQKSIPIRQRHIVNAICGAYAERIASWLSDRAALLQQFATSPDLRTNTESHTAALEAVAGRIDGFPGGFYTLDENGAVIDHVVRNHPHLNIRGRFNAAQREYFKEVQKLHRPVISNSFRSADRDLDILVLAVPRYDDAGRFIGILDGVIDVVSSSPFSKLAESLVTVLGVDSLLKGRPLIYLIDGKGVILGTNSAPETVGESVTAFAPEIRKTAFGFDVAVGTGAKKKVADTPFSVIVIFKADNQ